MTKHVAEFGRIPAHRRECWGDRPSAFGDGHLTRCRGRVDPDDPLGLCFRCRQRVGAHPSEAWRRRRHARRC